MSVAEANESARKSHVSLGQAEVTLIERDSGFTAIVGDHSPVGFVEQEGGLPAAGLIDPVTDQPAASIYVDEEGQLVLSSYRNGEPEHVVRMAGPCLEIDRPTTVKLGPVEVFLNQHEDGNPTIIVRFDGRPVAGAVCHKDGTTASLISANGQPTYSLIQLNDGHVCAMKHGAGKPIIVPCYEAAIQQN